MPINQILNSKQETIMKAIINNFIILLSIIFVVSSCKSDDMNYKDANVSPVNKLYEPTDGRAVKLLSSTTASLFFEWEAVKVEDSGSPLYEVVFDKEGGDFSNPIYRIVSDNSGYANHATILHKDLNKIAGLAGIEAEQTGAIIWTVVASRGLNEARAKESRNVVITRLAGFVDVPDEVFITGEASETGTNLAEALPFKLTATGEYEIYTKLTAGKTYQFVDRKEGTPRAFYADGTKLKEDGSTTTTTTGIYRINLDYNIGTVTYTKITSLGLFFCPNNVVLFNLDYVGKGVWTGQGKVVFKQESWGRDQRYKFQMETVNASGSAVTEQLGTVDGGIDNPPTSSTGADYFYLKRVSVNQWDNKWKFTSEMDNATVSISIYLQGNKAYTHTVTKAN